MIEKVKELIKSEPVLAAAWLLAIISAFWVRPDLEYIEYIDMDTLFLLFGLMVAMAGFKSLGLFQILGGALLSKVRTSRGVKLSLVLLCFFSSMFITNDVALITFVPIGIVTLKMAGLYEMIVPVAALQTVAANLGSMVTPMGNPQNIYLYFKSRMTAAEFMQLTCPYALLALVMLWACCMIGKKHTIQFGQGDDSSGKLNLNLGFWVYSAIFALCLCALGKLIPSYIAAAAAVIAVLAVDKNVLRKVDYGLLLTFIGFFIFVGNMGRLPVFSQVLVSVIEGHETAVAAGASQVISNVPAVLLLTGFTNNWESLIIGSNLGGLGTLIASMANLISYKWVCKEAAHFRHAYVRLFTILSVIFLMVECMLYFCINFV